jgi:hypothetical protein
MHRKILTVIFIISIFGYSNSGMVQRYSYDLSEGSKCPLNNDNGICKRAQDCTKGLQELQKNRNGVPVCGFVGKDSIICCPNQFESQRKFINLSYEYCVDEYLESRYSVEGGLFGIVNGVDVWPGEFTNAVSFFEISNQVQKYDMIFNL